MKCYLVRTLVLKLKFIVLFGLTIAILCCGKLLKPLQAAQTPFPAKAAIVQVDHRYYAIAGTTAAELRSQMSRLGPIDPTEDRRYDALTEWTVQWSYRFRQTGNQCAIRSASSRVTVTLTLPKWETPDSIERSLVAEWNHYLAALQRHEAGHQEHGIAAGKQVLQSLNHAPAYASCQALEGAVNAAAQQVIKRYNQKDVDYDYHTRHGYTQGAIFPPTTTVSR